MNVKIFIVELIYFNVFKKCMKGTILQNFTSAFAFVLHYKGSHFLYDYQIILVKRCLR